MSASDLFVVSNNRVFQSSVLHLAMSSRRHILFCEAMGNAELDIPSFNNNLNERISEMLEYPVVPEKYVADNSFEQYA